MRRKVTAFLLAGAIAVMSAVPAFAAQPPGQLGYEGQPGNQGGQHHNGQHAPGLRGYEGQPGNQGGH